jgi:hypothetical protein
MEHAKTIELVSVISLSMSIDSDLSSTIELVSVVDIEDIP